MNATVFAVFGSALVMNLACWGVGSALVTSDKPSIRMLGGWCVFFLIATIAWLGDLSGDATRPLVWGFVAAGVFFCARRRQWGEVRVAFICCGLVSLVLVIPYLFIPRLEAYGAFGVDMWGYISTSEWVRHHPIHQLPIPSPTMRYNWAWYVLSIRERPLIYTALACFGSAAGITPIQAYVAFAAALLASLSMSLCLTPRVFGLGRFVYAIPLAVLVSLHPLVLVHWIFQFFSGVVVSGCVCMAFAAILVTEKGRARMEALSLCLLMLAFCSALYSREFLLVGLVSAGIPAVVDLYGSWRASGFSLRVGKPISWLAWAAVAVAGVTAAGTLVFSRPTPYGGPSGHVVAQVFTIFGAEAPPWFGYNGIKPWDYVPDFDALGWIMATLTLDFFGYLAWTRWRQSRDVSIPVVCLTAAGCIFMVSNSLVSLSRVLPVFGPALLFGLAVVSSEIRNRSAAFAVALLCGLPLIRSSSVVANFLRNPDLVLRSGEPVVPPDEEKWRVWGYLFLHEDLADFNWKEHPACYFGLTEFLSDEDRRRIANQLGLPVATPPP